MVIEGHQPGHGVDMQFLQISASGLSTTCGSCVNLASSDELGKDACCQGKWKQPTAQHPSRPLYRRNRAAGEMEQPCARWISLPWRGGSALPGFTQLVLYVAKGGSPSITEPEH
ncbi:Hypothetical predicted protein [Marmota monax]|uniref:Uncharacterized protein n=1 Tax=Marmota monax TaxID=9995 RepID=A0A5E4AEU7_MARMO|nr:Hypothetical predicted protein [Marmota monax]